MRGDNSEISITVSNFETFKVTAFFNKRSKYILFKIFTYDDLVRNGGIEIVLRISLG